MLTESLHSSLSAIDWKQYATAYGSAHEVPKQIELLAGNDQAAAMQAAHDLWCGLCHQHAYVSSAALPALPFLLQILDSSCESLSVEILDILLGFAICKSDGSPSPPWINDLHQALARQRAKFIALSNNGNPELAEFANAIIENLA